MYGIGESTPGFDQPLGLLRACHRRIAERLDLLERLSDHVGMHGSDETAGAAAQRVLDYFDHAAAHHHEDEEEDLFPMLRSAQGRAGWDEALPDALGRLSLEHALLANQWAKLRPVLLTITRGQEVAEFRCNELIRSYRAHMSVEDGLVFPLAGRLLTDAELRRIGSSMQKRRGLTATADDAVLERVATAACTRVDGRAGRGKE
jgi:hemerythrin-like domain-containing protein